MTSKKNDGFKTIVDHYISHKDPNENKELEVRFGTRKIKNKKNINKSEYDMVIKNLKSMEFICDNVNGEYQIDVIARELNKNFLLELIFIFNLKSFLINLRKIIKYEKKSTCCMER